MSGVRMFSTFFLTDLLFAVEVKKVREIIRNLEITPVPTSSPRISGLINLRGQIVTTIDARRCLNLPVRSVGETSIHLILFVEDGMVSLLVDDVGAIVEFKEEQYESPPATLKGRLRDFVSGAYKLPGKLLMVLDIERMLMEVSEPLSISACEPDPSVNLPMGSESVPIKKSILSSAPHRLPELNEFPSDSRV
jgi:purine-binding chemotaxis protein CheW